MVSFLRAVDEGADGVELDLRFSRDGEFVVIHDPTFARTTDGRGRVSLTPSRVMREMDAGAWFRGHQTDVRVPLLEEVFEALPPPLLVNVELKASRWSFRRYGTRLARTLRRRTDRDRIVVSSFDRWILSSMRGMAPELRYGWLGGDPAVAVRLGVSAIHPSARQTTPELIRAARASNLAVHTWDANEKQELERLVRLGVDAIITDEVRRLHDLLDPDQR